jgi:RNA polymerase sigma-70 factor (ECF subfamily)
MPNNSGFESFCRDQQGRLVGILTLYCGDRDVAEELTQEALIRTYAAWGRVSKLDNPRGWTYRVAINLAKSYFRRRIVERRVQRQLGASRVASNDMPDVTGALVIRRSVASLPRQQRAVLILRYFADLSVKETAELLQLPEGTVKTLSRSAIERLRKDSRLEMEVRENVG